MIINDSDIDGAAAQVAGGLTTPGTPATATPAAQTVANPFEPATPTRQVRPVREAAALDAAAGAVVDGQRTQLRTSLYDSLLANPDVAARATQISRKTGIPPDVAERNYPEAKRNADLNEYDQLLTSSPRLAAYLGIPQQARMAHDDVPALSGVESFIGQVRGPDASFMSVASGLLGSFGTGARMAREGIRMQLADLFGSDAVRADAQRQYSQASLEADVNRPEFESSTAQGVYGGGESILRMAPGLAASILTRSPAPTLAAAGIQTEAEAYGKYRNRGATAGQALAGAVGEGAVEVGTELLPMSFLTKQFGRVGAGHFITGLLAREVPGEQIATFAQDAIDTAIANPDKTWDQFLKERPGAAYQTLVATLTQSGIMGGASAIAGRAGRKQRMADDADHNAEMLAQIAAQAEASKLRGRDTESFAQFVKQAAEDGPVTDVYLSAATLNQSGLDLAAIAELSPSIAAQFNDALETGGDMRIPVEEFAASLSGPDIAPVLIPHLRTDPGAMTQAEAATYMQTQGETLQADVERTLGVQQADSTFKTSRDAVTAQVAGQLAQANRFTPEVNQAYASLVGNFYAVQAAKLGITPEQMAKRYPLQVRAERLVGAMTLDQSPKVEEFTDLGSGFTVDGKTLMRNGAPVGDVKLEVESGGKGTPHLVVRDIRIKSPGKGTGTTALAAIMGKAAQYGMPVALTTESMLGKAHQKRLRAYYEKLGFKKNRGSDKVPGVTEEYVWTPPNTLNQTGNERGQISFGTDITQTPSIITLLKNADLSTALHEFGHLFLEIQADIARRPDAPDSVKQDMQATLDWLGVADQAAWDAMTIDQKRQQHEQFARGFEAYLFEGAAPSVEMAGVFQRFRAWMLNVYQSLSKLNVQLTDEVRGVFDRMLASNEQITEAETLGGHQGMFTSKPEFMTDEEWRSYQNLGMQATQNAVHELETRSLRDMQWLDNAKARKLRELQRDAATKRKVVRTEVETEVMSEPINQAREFLKTTKLDAAGMAEQYGGEGDKYALLDWKPIERMVGRDGVNPDMVAEMFGYTSGDQLVRELLTAPTAAEAIRERTDQRMLERYGDLTNPERLARATEAALADAARQRFLAAELAALERANNAREDADRTNTQGRRITVATLPRAAKAFAEATIARLRVRDIKPAQYTSAAARAARSAEAAFKKGEIEQAAVEKRNQLIQSYAARAATDALTEVDKAVAYFKKFGGDGPRKALATDYLDQIDALLERFDLRTGQSLRAIDRRKSLLAWAESQRDQGFEPEIPAELLDEAQRKSYKDMTMEELRGLVDTVKQIEHLGRLKNRLLTAKDQRQYEAIRDDIVKSIDEHAGDRQADTRSPTTTGGRVMQGLKKFWAAHIKIATLARVLDGGRDGGPVWEYFVRGANEAGDNEVTMRAAATLALSDIMAPVLKLGKMGGKGVFFPSINRSLNRESRIVIALNFGNESNIQRLLGGEGWTREQVKPVLDSLTKAEWDAVQAIWDHFESYRPLIEAKEKRVYGRAPQWLDPTPVQTTHGAYKGGYYPVKYDPNASQRAEEHIDAEGAQRQLQGAYTSATTRRSFTKTRAEEVVGRPLLYSLAGLYSGVNDVIHDLNWHEWLIDTNRLLRSQSIDRAIREHYGPEMKSQFKSWVNDIAEGDKGAANAGEVALGKLRQNVSVAGLGFNVMSAAMQGLGITQSIVRVGPAWIGKGIMQYLSAPIATTRTTSLKSDFMRNRQRTRYRELNELRNKVQAEITLDDTIKQYAYVLMMRAQQMVDVPTWTGAYDKAIAEGNDEKRSVALADQAVIDAQGGGQLKDVAAIERGGPALKLFTVFYSFMNTAFNLGVGQTMTAKSKAKLASDYLLLYTVPAVLGLALKNAITPGGDDDWDWGKLARDMTAAQISYLMGLMVVVREFGEIAKIATGVPSFGYQGPAGVRIVGDTAKFVKEAGQGEFDEGMRKASVNIVSDLTGLPGAQINRTITGAEALAQGKTDNPAALALGYQEKK